MLYDAGRPASSEKRIDFLNEFSTAPDFIAKYTFAINDLLDDMKAELLHGNIPDSSFNDSSIKRLKLVGYLAEALVKDVEIEAKRVNENGPRSENKAKLQELLDSFEKYEK
ncbi:MAG: hypothetical protein FWE45_02165 [Firmicutes bacterium]|nr:hypothetical protein [Bacillota bacterium]